MYRHIIVLPQSLKADISYSKQTCSPLATLGWGQGGGCTKDFVKSILAQIVSTILVKIIVSQKVFHVKS